MAYADLEKKRANSRRDYAANRAKYCARAREYRRTHQEERVAYMQQYREQHRDELRNYSRNYAAAHKEEQQQRNAAYRKTNAVELAEACRRWRQNNPDKQRKSTRRWRQANKDKVAAASRRRYQAARDDILRKRRQDYAADPTAARMAEQRRRARKACASGAAYTTLQHLEWRRQMWGGRCYLCGSEDAPTMDHVIPLVKGGSHWPANLRPCCKSCNSAKGTKSLAEYLRVRNSLTLVDTMVA